jgi:glycosyltransferase involved in cell wall biosynthesis
MRVLYLSQYFPPEIGATQTRALEMAKGLVAAGHRVTVLTEFPNHPVGVIQPEYRWKLWQRSRCDGIDVVRLWVKASPAGTFRSRIAFYLSYMVMAVLAGIFVVRGKYNLIFATSPPLFVGAAALAIRFVRRVPMVFEVRDLWPESAVELGQLRSERAQKLATRLEERCYRSARHVVAVTQGIMKRLEQRGVPAEKLTLIPNGANTELFSPRARDVDLRVRLGIAPNAYVVIYTGLLGLVADLDTMLQTANLLRSESDIVFLIVGDGPRREALLRKAEEMQLTNVVFHRAVEERELPRFLSLGDAGLHANRDLEICRGGLSVKLFSYMASGLPVVLAGEGEPQRFVEAAKAGIVVAPEDPEALADGVLELRADPDAKRFGDAGVAYVRARHSRRDLAQRLVETLEAASAEVTA